MKGSQAAALVMALTSMYAPPVNGVPQAPHRSTSPLRICLNPKCSTKHHHNNSYCSSECCKEHRQLIKETKTNGDLP